MARLCAWLATPMGSFTMCCTCELSPQPHDCCSLHKHGLHSPTASACASTQQELPPTDTDRSASPEAVMSSTLRKLSWVLDCCQAASLPLHNGKASLCRLDIVGYPSPSMHIIFNGEQVLEACCLTPLLLLQASGILMSSIISVQCLCCGHWQCGQQREESMQVTLWTGVLGGWRS